MLGLDVYFEGQEKDQYKTNMLGLAITNQTSENLKLKWMVSRFENDEQENIDIAGAYLFGERDFDKAKPTYRFNCKSAWCRSVSKFCPQQTQY